jgi:Tol biopolymer transport system component
MRIKNWLEEIGFPLLDRKAVAGLLLFWILVLSVGGCLLVGMAQRLSPETGDQVGLFPATLTQTNTRALSEPVLIDTLEPSPTPLLLPGELTSLPLTRTAEEQNVLFPTQTLLAQTPRPTLVSTNTRLPTATWNIFIFTRVVSTSYYQSLTPRPTNTTIPTTPVPTTHVPTTAVPVTMTPSPTTTTTYTLTPTETLTPTLTSTSTQTVTPTLEALPTVTPTETMTPSVTVTVTPTPTATETATPTATETETPTPTVTTVSTVISFSADFIDLDTEQDNYLDLVQVNEKGDNFRKILADDENTLMGDWSPDGKKIVFVIQNATTQRLYTIASNGTAKTTIANQPEGRNSDPQWSPNGKWIVHVNREPSRDVDSANLWVVPTNGDPAISLTSSLHEDIEPAWSPDGNTLVFVRNNEIYKLDIKELHYEADTSPQAFLKLFLGFFSNNARTSIEITATPQPLFNSSPVVVGRWPRYSPDGEYLIFEREGKIIRLDLAEKVELNLTEGMPVGSAHTPSWSPDGNHIVFIFHTNGESARDDIWIVSKTGEKREELVLPIELVEKYRPVWKP